MKIEKSKRDNIRIYKEYLIKVVSSTFIRIFFQFFLVLSVASIIQVVIFLLESKKRKSFYSPIIESRENYYMEFSCLITYILIVLIFRKLSINGEVKKLKKSMDLIHNKWVIIMTIIVPMLAGLVIANSFDPVNSSEVENKTTINLEENHSVSYE